MVLIVLATKPDAPQYKFHMTVRCLLAILGILFYNSVYLLAINFMVSPGIIKYL